MAELLIMHWKIDLDASPVLYDRPFSAQSLREDWEVRNAEYRCEGDAFIGRNPLPAAGALLSRRAFPGNVLMDFYAQTVAPSTHDIDVMWNVSWDEEKNLRGPAYVAGVQGWWDGKVGIEKAPEYKLAATVPCPWFKPGRRYHIQAGSVGGECFIFVDGELRLELFDPDPIDSKRHNRVGFEAYQSIIRVEKLIVRQIVAQGRKPSYPAEF